MELNPTTLKVNEENKIKGAILARLGFHQAVREARAAGANSQFDNNNPYNRIVAKIQDAAQAELDNLPTQE